jgi:hypothetical protein
VSYRNSSKVFEVRGLDNSTQHHDVVCAPSHKTHNIIISTTNINIIFEADAYARDPNPEA